MACVMMADLGETFGKRLKRIRESVGLSQRELAKRSGVDREYIVQIEGGRVQSPGWRIALSLAKGLGLSVSAFEDATAIRETPPPYKPSSDDILDRIRDLAPRRIPIVAEGSAGPGIDAEYTVWTGSKALEPYIIAVKVRGDCLEPDLHDGDTVIANTQETARDNDLVVCLVDGKRMVKRYRQKGKEQWIENGSGRLSFDECQIQGVVLKIISDVRRRQ